MGLGATRVTERLQDFTPPLNILGGRLGEREREREREERERHRERESGKENVFRLSDDGLYLPMTNNPL